MAISLRQKAARHTPWKESGGLMAKAKAKHYDESTAQSVAQALKAMQTDPDIQPERGQKSTSLKAVIRATAQEIRAAYDQGYTLEQITTALRAKAQVSIAPKTLRQYLAEVGCNLRPNKEDNTATKTTTTNATTATETTASSRQPKQNGGGGIVVTDDVI
jgi:transposase